MFRKPSQEHANKLANEFVDRVTSNLYASALVDFTYIGSPPRAVFKPVDDLAEVHALLARYRENFDMDPMPATK